MRLGGLAKYLPRFGWEPIILTTVLSNVSPVPCQVIQSFYPGDYSAWVNKIFRLNPNKKLVDQFAFPQSMKEGKNLFPRILKNCIESIVAYPDKQRGWSPFAVKSGEEFLKATPVDVIFSSSSPVTCHLIAQKLKMFSSVPWVADFRDLWTQDHYYRFGPVRRWIDRRLEKQTLSSANALTRF